MKRFSDIIEAYNDDLDEDYLLFEMAVLRALFQNVNMTCFFDSGWKRIQIQRNK